jgi:biotin operon repressor
MAFNPKNPDTYGTDQTGERMSDLYRWYQTMTYAERMLKGYRETIRPDAGTMIPELLRMQEAHVGACKNCIDDLQAWGVEIETVAAVMRAAENAGRKEARTQLAG